MTDLKIKLTSETFLMLVAFLLALFVSIYICGVYGIYAWLFSIIFGEREERLKREAQ